MTLLEVVLARGISSWRLAYIMRVHEVLTTTAPAGELGQVHLDYLPWYVRVSLPRLLPVAPPSLVAPAAPAPTVRGHPEILDIVEEQLRWGLETGDIPHDSRVYSRFMRLLALVEGREGRE